MKRLISAFLTVSFISSASSNVIACGAPNGQELNIKWKSSPTNIKVNDKTNLLPSVLIPILNFMNSTPESRSDGDVMSDNQIAHSLDAERTKFTTTGTKTTEWNKFYDNWYSSANNSYDQILLDSHHKETEAGPDKKGKVGAKFDVVESQANIAAAFNDTTSASPYHDLKKMSEDKAHESNFIISAIPTFKIELSFLGQSFTVDIHNLVGTMEIIKYPNPDSKAKEKNLYKWYFIGYFFPPHPLSGHPEIHNWYPTNSRDPISNGTYSINNWRFINSSILLEQPKDVDLTAPYIDYSIEQDSIQIV